MSFNDLYRRANVESIASFLHYGSEWNESEDSKTFKERMKEAEDKMSDFLQKNLISSERCDDALDEFFVQIEECTNVYLEMGLIMGIKIAFEIHSKGKDLI